MTYAAKKFAAKINVPNVIITQTNLIEKVKKYAFQIILQKSSIYPNIYV